MKLFKTSGLTLIKRVLPFMIVLAILFATIFYPSARSEGKGDEVKTVIRVWNVDTFEGGKGSRTTFLKRVAAKVEKRRKEVYYLITSYTAEGILHAFESGQKPDMLSFGIGVSAYLESSLPLPYSFAGGQTESGCYAYPWCRGAYYLFSLTDNFEEEGAVAISSGGSNLVEVAAALHFLVGDRVDSLSAYVAFLNGQYRYLLGTQRDVCRFVARGVEVYQKPLNEFCDLYQYISVLSVEKRDDCFALVEELLSDGVQKDLDTIGMLPVKGDGAMRTVSAFIGSDVLNLVRDAAVGTEPVKNLDKFLKNI